MLIKHIIIKSVDVQFRTPSLRLLSSVLKFVYPWKPWRSDSISSIFEIEKKLFEKGISLQVVNFAY